MKELQILSMSFLLLFYINDKLKEEDSKVMKVLLWATFAILAILTGLSIIYLLLN